MPTNPDIRIEKGRAEAEEVAAITAVLLTRCGAAASRSRSCSGHDRARWRESGYRAPNSWH
ncbi:acyl-CoA carboxylase subunit epsilon [Streptomyces beihaiensis]|uniref:Acyl-CoA carboxylase subunit epsilon n=1 Tax=Streptomyces beihaiensis TaxID=2984495 RepID=A0ABT3U2R0_9ACTN|nr:acyl-CoA carboxylase subunit epsilon [Streptomyces beihaiensis]MCX3063596.1 acyl-CoA carboxylase subunit epsilon [Streptomyces beihaiensis]